MRVKRAEVNAVKIESSNIRFTSQHLAKTQHERQESVRSWIGSPPPPANATMAARPSLPRPTAPLPATPPTSAHEADAELEWSETDPRARVLIMMIEKMTGQKVRLLSMKDLRPEAPTTATPPPPTPSAPAPEQVGWGVEYDFHEFRHEEETTNFGAAGVVRTTDGQEIRFNYDLGMHREFTQEETIHIAAGDAARKKDPLVINFNGTAAQLTDATYQFDLDVDGRADQIAFLQGGSGFLALDRNANGAIDDGSELFGAQSGDGFKDLAAYDTDGNHWIDEQDPIYQQLRVWTKDAQGTNALTTLAQRNVGAIYLQSQNTPFSLRGSANQDLGDVRASGIYLSEQGTVGSVQQIDLAV